MTIGKNPNPKKCTTTNCERPHYAHGLCSAHYQRKHRGRNQKGPIIEQHGQTKRNKNGKIIRTGTYQTWLCMKHRCNDPKHKAYPNYGGRGIKICKQWQHFPTFYKDMGDRPKGMTIDRINQNGNYEPNNCRWADASTQNRNRRPFKRNKQQQKGKTMTTLIQNIDKEIKKAKTTVKQLQNEIKALEQAKQTLKGKKTNKTTKKPPQNNKTRDQPQNSK